MKCKHKRDGAKCPGQSWNSVSVVCSQKPFKSENDDMEISLVLRTEKFKNNGYVRIKKHGILGRVCSENWGDNEANVFCREMGFKGGKAYNFLFKKSLPFWITNINCNGTEKYLKNCKMNDKPVKQCSMSKRKDAGVLCFTEDVKFKLSEGSSGVPKIYFDGRWGQICGENLKAMEAKVICSQLGYETGRVSYIFKKSSPLYFFHVYYCIGNEKSILQCFNQGWNVTNSCQSYQTPYITCIKSLQLVGIRLKDKAAGALSIAVNFGHTSNWYSICGKNWDDKDAVVACKQLGYNSGRAAYSIKGKYVDYSTYMFTDFACTGSESKLKECSSRKAEWSSGLFCDYRIGYASVICYNKKPLDYFSVNIAQSSTEFSGIPSITYNGINGYICANGWTNEDAKVFCRHKNLIYTDGIAYKTYTSSRSNIFWLDNIRCTGSEEHLENCKHSGIGNITNHCSSGPAGVLCLDKTAIKYKLSDEKNNRGRVDVTVNGKTGTLCNLNHFDNLEASAICRTINEKYTGGLVDR